MDNETRDRQKRRYPKPSRTFTPHTTEYTESLQKYIDKMEHSAHTLQDFADEQDEFFRMRSSHLLRGKQIGDVESIFDVHVGAVKDSAKLRAKAKRFFATAKSLRVHLDQELRCTERRTREEHHPPSRSPARDQQPVDLSASSTSAAQPAQQEPPSTTRRSSRLSAKKAQK